MDFEIKKLSELTTIVKIFNNTTNKTVLGKNYLDKFNKNQGKQVNLNTLEPKWEKKWKSFNDSWPPERQNYRFLYHSFRLFYFSFEQLNFNKISCINETFGDKFKMFHFNDISGVGLYGIYHHGKKCIDLLERLQSINKNHNKYKFLNKFKETRNKIIEHNLSPYGLNLRLEPSIWSLVSTNSLLEIHIHKPDKERAFDAYVDYYEDYYKLEKIITDIINKF